MATVKTIRGLQSRQPVRHGNIDSSKHSLLSCPALRTTAIKHYDGVSRRTIKTVIGRCSIICMSCCFANKCRRHSFTMLSISFYYRINFWASKGIRRLENWSLCVHISLADNTRLRLYVFKQAVAAYNVVGDTLRSTQRILSKQFVFSFLDCFLSYMIRVAIFDSSDFYWRSWRCRNLSSTRGLNPGAGLMRSIGPFSGTQSDQGVA